MRQFARRHEMPLPVPPQVPYAELPGPERVFSYQLPSLFLCIKKIKSVLGAKGRAKAIAGDKGKTDSVSPFSHEHRFGCHEENLQVKPERSFAGIAHVEP